MSRANASGPAEHLSQTFQIFGKFSFSNRTLSIEEVINFCYEMGMS